MPKYYMDWNREINAHDIKQLRKRKTMRFILTAITEEGKVVKAYL